MAAPEFYVNEDGTTKLVEDFYVKDQGQRKQIVEGWINDEGTNKQFYGSVPPPDIDLTTYTWQSDGPVVNGFTFQIGNDGNTLYYIDGASTIGQYSFGVPYDLTTTTWEKVTDISSEINSIGGHLQIASDGASLYLTNALYNLARLSLSTPWDIETAALQETTTNPLFVGAMWISPDGTKIWSAEQVFPDTVFRQFTLPTPFIVTGAVFDHSITLLNESVFTFTFTSDGMSVLLVAFETHDTVQRYSLAAPWDIENWTLEADTLVAQDVSGNNDITQIQYGPADEVWILVNKNVQYWAK